MNSQSIWSVYCKLGSSFFSTFAAVSIAIAVNILTILCFDNEDVSILWILLVISWFIITYLGFKISSQLKIAEANFYKLNDEHTNVSTWVFNSTHEKIDKLRVNSFLALIVLNFISMIGFWLFQKYFIG